MPSYILSASNSKTWIKKCEDICNMGVVGKLEMIPLVAMESGVQKVSSKLRFSQSHS